METHWENAKCIWDYELLLRIQLRPLRTGCAVEDEDERCSILKDAQRSWLMCTPANAEGASHSRGTGKDQPHTCLIPPPPSAQPGDF